MSEQGANASFAADFVESGPPREKPKTDPWTTEADPLKGRLEDQKIGQNPVTMGPLYKPREQAAMDPRRKRDVTPHRTVELFSDPGFSEELRQRGALEAYEQGEALAWDKNAYKAEVRRAMILNDLGFLREEVESGLAQQATAHMLGLEDDHTQEEFDSALGEHVKQRVEDYEKRSEAFQQAMFDVFTAQPKDRKVYTDPKMRGYQAESLDTIARLSPNQKLFLKNFWGAAGAPGAVFSSVAGESEGDKDIDGVPYLDKVMEGYVNMTPGEREKALQLLPLVIGPKVDQMPEKAVDFWDTVYNRLQEGREGMAGFVDQNLEKLAYGLGEITGIDALQYSDEEIYRKELESDLFARLKELRGSMRSKVDPGRSILGVQMGTFAQMAANSLGEALNVGWHGPASAAGFAHDYEMQERAATFGPHPYVARPFDMIRQSAKGYAYYRIGRAQLKLLDPRAFSGGWLKQITLRSAGEAVQEFGQEFVPTGIDQLAAWADSDLAGPDWAERWRGFTAQWKEGALLIVGLSALTGGARVQSDMWRAKSFSRTTSDADLLEMNGVPRPEAEAIAAIEDPKERMARIQDLVEAGQIVENPVLDDQTAARVQEKLRRMGQEDPDADGPPQFAPEFLALPDGRVRVTYPDSQAETFEGQEQAMAAARQWAEDKVQSSRSALGSMAQIPVEERANLEKLFEAERKRLEKAQPGLKQDKVQAGRTLMDAVSEGQVTLESAKDRVRDYAYQQALQSEQDVDPEILAAEMVEAFVAGDKKFYIEGTAGTDARIENGMLVGAMQLLEGKKDLFTLYEEAVESHIHGMVNSGRLTYDQVRQWARELEKQTGKKILSGKSDRSAVEAISFVAKAYATQELDLMPSEAKGIFDRLIQVLMDLVGLARQISDLKASGKLNPALEENLRAGLGLDGGQLYARQVETAQGEMGIEPTMAISTLSEDHISRIDPASDKHRVGTSLTQSGNDRGSNISRAMVSDAVLEKNMRAMSYAHLPATIRNDKNPQRKADKLIEWLSQNLLALHDAFNPEHRARATHWYDGANRIARRMARRYSISSSQAAGILAVFSPQKDWFMNVAQAEQATDVYLNYSRHKLTPARMQEPINAAVDAVILGDREKYPPKKNETKRQKEWRLAENRRRKAAKQERHRAYLEQIVGKTIAGLKSDPTMQAWAIRLMARHLYGPYFRVVSPEGDMMQWQTNNPDKKTGEVLRTQNTWGSAGEIRKAVQILEDGSEANLSAQLGKEHKVRSFYNNIIAPNSPFQDATMDTHAVAAAHLLPMGSSAQEVSHNLGAGAGGTIVGGVVSGTYWVYLEAYRRAAAARGLQARQMQSITWEAIRLRYNDAQRRDKKFIAEKRKVWQNSRDARSARKSLLAEGIPDPAWVGSGAGRKSSAVGSRVSQAEPAGRSDRGGRVRGRGASGRGTRSGSGEVTLSIEEEHQQQWTELADRWEERGVITDPKITTEGAVRPYVVVVPKELRKQGLGSQIMQEMTALADEQGRWMILNPSTEFGATSVARLRRFYARFGFYRNFGRRKDFRWAAAMIRPPKGGETTYAISLNEDIEERGGARLEREGGRAEVVPGQAELLAENMAEVVMDPEDWEAFLEDLREGTIAPTLLGIPSEAKVVELETLWVDQNYRGEGVGSALMQQVEDYAREQGASHVIIWAGTTDSMAGPSRGFYEKKGYEVHYYSEATQDAVMSKRVAPTFSISEQAATGIKSQMQNKPAEMVEVYQAMLRSIDRIQTRMEAQRLHGIEDDGSSAFESIEALATYDAILTALPGEARGRLGGFANLASLQTDAARRRFLEQKLPQIESALDKFVGDKGRAEIARLLKKHEVKVDPKTGVPKGKGAAFHNELDRIREVLSMDMAEVSAREDQLEDAISTATDLGEIEALTEDLVRLATWGNLMQKGKQRRKALDVMTAQGELQHVIKRGLSRYRMIQENQRARRESRREKFLQVITGGKGLKGEAQDKRDQEARDKRLLREGLSDWHLKNQSWEWLLNAASREGKAGTLKSSLTKWGARLVHTATHHERRMVSQRTEELSRFLAGVFDIKITRGGGWRRTLSQALEQHGERTDKTGVFRVELKPSKRKLRIPIEKCYQVLNGEVKPEALGLIAQDVQALDSMVKENEALPPQRRKRVLELEHRTDEGMKEQRLSQDEAIYLSMLYQQDGAREAMQHWGYTDETMLEIEAFLNDQSKEIRAWLAGKYEGNWYELNPVYERMFGHTMPQIGNYSPGRWHHEGREATMAEQMLDDVKVGASTTPGFAKKRITHRARPRQDVGALDLYAEHMKQSAHFVAWAEPMKELRAVFSHRDTQDALRQYGGKTLPMLINERLDFFANGGNRVLSNRFLDFLRRNFTIAALSYNWGVALKQLTSIPAFAFDMPPHKLLQYELKALTDWKGLRELAESEFVRERFKTGFDRDLMLVLRRAGQKKGRNRLQFLLEQGMIFGRTGDIVPVIFGGYAVYHWTYDSQIAAGSTPEVAKKEAQLAFEMSVERAQQAGDVKDQSHFQSQGSMARLFTMFLTSPRQYYSNVYEGLLDWRAGHPGARAEFIRRLIVGHIALPFAFQFVSDVVRNVQNLTDDDDETGLLDLSPADYVRSFLLGPLNGIFVVGHALTTLSGHAVNMGVELINSAAGEEKLKKTKVWGYQIPIIENLEGLGPSVKKAGLSSMEMLKDPSAEKLGDIVNGIGEAVSVFGGQWMAYDIGARVVRSVGMDDELGNLVQEPAGRAAEKARKARSDIYGIDSDTYKGASGAQRRRIDRYRYEALAKAVTEITKNLSPEEIEEFSQEMGTNLPWEVRRRSGLPKYKEEE